MQIECRGIELAGRIGVSAWRERLPVTGEYIRKSAEAPPLTSALGEAGPIGAVTSGVSKGLGDSGDGLVEGDNDTRTSLAGGLGALFRTRRLLAPGRVARASRPRSATQTAMT